MTSWYKKQKQKPFSNPTQYLEVILIEIWLISHEKMPAMQAWLIRLLSQPHHLQMFNTLSEFIWLPILRIETV
jgi:hypothetical protein